MGKPAPGVRRMGLGLHSVMKIHISLVLLLVTNAFTGLGGNYSRIKLTKKNVVDSRKAPQRSLKASSVFSLKNSSL